VFEIVRFIVHLRPGDHRRKHPFRQHVPPHDGFGQPQPVSGQAKILLGMRSNPAIPHHAFERIGDRRRRNIEKLCQARANNCFAIAFVNVDGA
jgi:hypothetical protein